MERATLHSRITAAPIDGEAYWTQTEDKVRLRMALWRGRGERGTVFVLPGRSDYIEMYGHSVTALTEQGFAAVVIDWRGHGLSDRIALDPQKGHVKQFLDYQRDVTAMFACAARLNLPRPYFLLGHSLGACIGLRALTRGLEVKACAFTAPMWDIHLPAVQRLAAWPITWAARAFGKGESYSPGYSGTSMVLKRGFDGNRLTSDPDMYAYWARQGAEVPALHTGGPSMNWLFEALKETRSLSVVKSPAVPCIVFYGEDEEIIDVEAIKARMTTWPGGRMRCMAKARHELLLERPEIRDNILSDICGFFLEA